MRILTFCGSLRRHSSNRAILLAYERLAPASVSFEQYAELGDLPHFNPANDGESVPELAAELRQSVSVADAIVISTPEYAHALPGSFKNALDWLVSDPAFAGKPVIILQAARGSTRAVDSLKEVLATMSARILEAASVALPLGSNRIDADAILAHEGSRRLLLGSIEVLMQETDAASPHHG